MWNGSRIYMSSLHRSHTNLCNCSNFRCMPPKPEAHTFFIEFYKNDIFLGCWAFSLSHLQAQLYAQHSAFFLFLLSPLSLFPSHVLSFNTGLTVAQAGLRLLSSRLWLTQHPEQMVLWDHTTHLSPVSHLRPFPTSSSDSSLDSSSYSLFLFIIFLLLTVVRNMKTGENIAIIPEITPEQ